MEQIRIEDGGLLIRSAGPCDAAQLAAWWNDGAVMAHAGFPLGLNTTAEQVEQQLLDPKNANNHVCIIEIDRVPAGEMNYRDMGGGTAEIGIKICDAAKQNRGQGSRLLTLLLRWLFTEKGFEKVVLDTNLNNLRAQHVYEKLGFRKTGVSVDSWKNQLGELQSSVEYELTKEEFVASHPLS